MVKLNYNSCPLNDPSQEIRLIALSPSPDFASRLQCTLFTTPLAQPRVPFRALSYSWGPKVEPKNMDTIHTTLGDTTSASLPTPASSPTYTIPITPSLSTALRHLRPAKGKLVLWIDQICINQSNPAEKGPQVALMGKLYASASQVLVWLGPPAPGSDEVMDAWHSIGYAVRAWGMEGYYTRERISLLHAMSNGDNHSDENTRALQDIMKRAARKFAPMIKNGTLGDWFNREWFTRVWVVQEFCMCADTVFACGDKRVAVELVMLAVQVLQFACGSLRKEGFEVFLPPEMPLERLYVVNEEPTARFFSCRMRRRKLDRGEEGAMGDRLYVLLRKLFVGRDTRATRHRDRVFGLLGLAVDAEELGIRPDYGEERTEASILTEAARAMIEVGGAVGVLCFSQFPKLEDVEELPSWVPDWRANLQPSYYSITETVDPHLFAASGDSTVEVVPWPIGRNADSVLSLSGYFVDEVEQVATDSWDDMSWDHVRLLTFLSQFEGLYEASMDKQVAIYGERTRERKEQARWRAPIGDLYWTQQEGRQRATPDVVVEYGRFLANLLAIHELAFLEGPDLHAAADRLAEQRRAGMIGTYYRESMTIMQGKRPFLTRDGRLGMGPSGTVPGDVVVVFCGGRIPFVLRPKSKEERLFSFVGEAYCDGVMDGEILDNGRQVFFLE
ncbi:HET-6OR heterokaryon incompatibility protein (het-6OR allele) [Podospora aff. communis PSN243]|uniref:HET-6OR heterokaryon incompatibility protein (Het-6OR allele) n=1 Tax=Podospora aff. communis PSN243 TaxID=3040156 RepID=A0AAV9GWD1_9PEZI|nr:HET-6OR heterokaryon incompatibility protein (het-6OR allele) [Podospora aff. communis PSN243]